MSVVPAPPDPARGVAARVARNAGVRAVAELAGKFLTLALLVVLGRVEGSEGVGTFVFAMAWAELAAIPLNMGFDRHFLRRVARDRAELEASLLNVLALKLVRALPVVAASWLLLWALNYHGETATAVHLLTFAFLFESVRLTLVAAFNGVERGDLVGTLMVVQRLVSGVLGALVLVLGWGVVAVAAMYVVGTAAAVAVGVRALVRRVGLGRPALSAERRRELRRGSLAFGAQDIFSSGIARLDTVLLSLMAASAVVGVYGAAYRLLEATLFIPAAALGAFSAMYTYLDEHSTPTIRAAYARSIKLVFVLLLPCAIPLAVIPGPILELFYGDGFEGGAGALRYLALTIVVLGNVMLNSSLIASRLDPRSILRCFAAGFAVNVGLNVALIPPLGATGAALAMLGTELLLWAMMLRLVVPAVGAPPVLGTVGSAAVAGAAMAAVVAALHGVVLAALAAGAVVYPVVFWLVERRVAPADLAVLAGMLPGRLGARLAASPR